MSDRPHPRERIYSDLLYKTNMVGDIRANDCEPIKWCNSITDMDSSCASRSVSTLFLEAIEF